MVATSSLGDERAALNEVSAALVAQLNEASERREPMNNRQRRESIRTA
ncbi:MAG: hypothetical protein V9F04_05190 [Dermatophilaceae bacterium]